MDTEQFRNAGHSYTEAGSYNESDYKTKTLTPNNYRMDFTGTIKKIGALETAANDFKKRQLVLLTEEQYPQPISIDFLQEKFDLPEVYKEGDKVKISVNHRGREWTSPTGDIKYFNSIVGWKIEKL